VPASTPDDNPLLNNTIHPTASYDTIDSKTRPTSMARQDSLSGSITNRGTFPMYVYHVCVCLPYVSICVSCVLVDSSCTCT